VPLGPGRGAAVAPTRGLPGRSGPLPQGPARGQEAAAAGRAVATRQVAARRDAPPARDVVEATVRGGRGRRARAGADDRASAALDGDGGVGAAGVVPSLANMPLRAAGALRRRLLLGAPTRRQPLATKLTHHAPRAQASEGDLRDRASWAELRRGGATPSHATCG